MSLAYPGVKDQVDIDKCQTKIFEAIQDPTLNTKLSFLLKDPKFKFEIVRCSKNGKAVSFEKRIETNKTTHGIRPLL